VHCVGEFLSACRRRNRRLILDIHILGAKQLRECVPSRAFSNPDKLRSTPAGFEQLFAIRIASRANKSRGIAVCRASSPVSRQTSALG
jgi:hypothetical protein